MASSVEEPATVPTWIREQAELGNPKALKELGYAYYLGKFGLKVDYDKAFECWEKAAAKKNKNAICCLGDCYKHGHGVERDVAKAFKLYKRSSKMGCIYANSGLAECDDYGEGVCLKTRERRSSCTRKQQSTATHRRCATTQSC